MKKINIAIDWTSWSGKWTTALWVAKILWYTHIDSWAMYRAFALYCLRNNINFTDIEKIKKTFENINIDFKINKETWQNETYLNWENVEWLIRTVRVSTASSKIAQIQIVRDFLIKQQQDMWKNWWVVMDWRDIWEKVYPNAEIKIFLVAELEERGIRRKKDLEKKWEIKSLEEVINHCKERDERDAKNTYQTEDSIEIDTTNLTIEQQVQKVIDLVNERKE